MGSIELLQKIFYLPIISYPNFLPQIALIQKHAKYKFQIAVVFVIFKEKLKHTYTY